MELGKYQGSRVKGQGSRVKVIPPYPPYPSYPHRPHIPISPTTVEYSG
ncbi:MAG: hypothetical protein ACFKPT_31255 [Gloeotrichia echinulata GP01]